MSKAVILDSGPLGMVTKRPGKSPDVDACQLWLISLLANGWEVYLPEIIDYEVRRELVRSGQMAGISRLDALHNQVEYIPVTTQAMRLASDLWAQARNAGWVTAAPQALDGDVILVAQTLTLSPVPTQIIVATTNVAHLSHFLAADAWGNIAP